MRSPQVLRLRLPLSAARFLLPALGVLLLAPPPSEARLSPFPQGTRRAEAEKREPEPPGDRELERAWKKLSREERFEIAEWFRAEAEWLGAHQNKLAAFVLASGGDPGLWPEPAPVEYFDPEHHAPGDPIPRRRLRETDGRVKRVHEKVFFRVPERELDPGFGYDYARREVQRLGPLVDPERVFRNALRGYLPDHGRVEALVEQALDDGSLQEHAAAFGHAYTDRRGNVYPGITLYDAYSSGAEMEMPDVDCLGIIHTLLNDWRTWKAPVPDRKHDALYERIGKLYADLHRHRGLRTALARCYLSSEPVLRDGYAGSVDRLHALWEHHRSEPEALREVLPTPARWEAFLEKWSERCEKEPELLEAGRNRRAHLAAGEARIRALLVSVMEQSGALPTEEEKSGR